MSSLQRTIARGIAKQQGAFLGHKAQIQLYRKEQLKQEREENVKNAAKAKKKGILGKIKTAIKSKRRPVPEVK